jgi:hypothetical protein
MRANALQHIAAELDKEIRKAMQQGSYIVNYEVDRDMHEDFCKYVEAFGYHYTNGILSWRDAC